VAKQLTKEKELIDKIKGAMFYPLIILVLGLVIGLALAFFVLPKITPIFTALKVDLPITTRFLIWFSGLIQNYGFILLAILVGFIIFAIWLARQKFFKPVSHFLFLHLPIISKLSRYKNLSQFCRTLGTLLRSGLSLDEALQITENTVSNYYYKKSIAEVGRRISRGGTLSENLTEYSEYFPRLTIGMIRVGEKSGSLEEEFFNLANIYETEVDNTAKTLSTAVEPILLIIIGVIVGGLALSIITPIYKITGSVYR
jgi:type II secretory pathway component PulF